MVHSEPAKHRDTFQDKSTSVRYLDTLFLPELNRLSSRDGEGNLCRTLKINTEVSSFGGIFANAVPDEDNGVKNSPPQTCLTTRNCFRGGERVMVLKST